MKYHSLEAGLQALINAAYNRALIATKKAERDEARHWHQAMKQLLLQWHRHKSHSEYEPECPFCVER